MNITVRKGVPADATWIVALLKEGAQSGHFGHTLVAQAPALLDAIFKNGGIMMMKLRNEIQAPCFVSADVLVADLDGKSASFLIPLREDNEVELHLIGTKKSARRCGCFKNLVQHEIEQHNTSMRIYARCYKKSTWAVEGLKKEGFEITKTGEPIELTLRR